MRFSRIKDNFIAMFPQLGRIKLETLREDELYQAERDLMGAELNAEHWIAQRDMLRNRVSRLKALDRLVVATTTTHVVRDLHGADSLGTAFVVGRG